MQNWDIIDTCDLYERDENVKNNNLLMELIEENEYDLELNKDFKEQLGSINILIKEINEEKRKLVNSFPSCSLAIVGKLNQTDSQDDDQMDIDQISFSNSEIMHSNNDSPILESRNNADLNESLTDSPESMNISDFL